MTVSIAKRARKSSKSVKVAANVLTGLDLHNAELAPLTTTALTVCDDAVNAVLDQLAIDTGASAVSVADDVDAVLAAIGAETPENAPSDAASDLRAIALAFSQSDVDATIQKVRDAFEARDAFEVANGLSLADKSSSYMKARTYMLANAVAVARGFLALNVEPVNVIRRKVVENREFTAKGLDKVTELCAFICGNTSRFQKVSQAFIACAIAVADRDDAAIGNKVNKAFLSNASFDRLVNDAELAAYLQDYQHKFMSGGRDTQSSQVRNVLDVLGLADIVTVDHARGGLAIKRDHGFYSLFRDRYMTRATA